MDSEKFDALVLKLEQHARRYPARYRFKVLLLALLGNMYLGAILLLVVALMVALLLSVVTLKALAIKLVLIVGAFLWMIVKALWVTITPPDGTEIRRKQAPQLFALIDGLRRQLRAPRFHHVLVTDDFNAGVVQVPRLGIFGWHSNYLLIGLPLLKTLTVDQFKAVLAHEFGHLAKGHGRVSNWIYRQRRRWSRLLGALAENSSRGSFLFKPFLNWFAPYFNAFSFPLARANEYEADATSVRLTSASAAAEALTSVSVIGCYLDQRFWPNVHKLADDQPRPNFMPYHTLSERLPLELDELSTQRWLQQALSYGTTSADTHPSLQDRLQAIGEAPRIALPAAGAAADGLLGAALPEITRRMDESWQERVFEGWQRRHRDVQNARNELRRLEAKHADGDMLTLQEGCDRANLTEAVGPGADAALLQFRALHEQAPDEPYLCLSLGVRLLGRDDVAGIALIERAIELDERAMVQGFEVLRDYHWRNGRREEAQSWHEKMLERVQLEQAAAHERNTILLKDSYTGHELGEEQLETLRAHLRGVQGLGKAYLVKKQVRYFPDRPCYVFGFIVQRSGLLRRRRFTPEAVMVDLKHIVFPGETLIVSVEGVNYRFGRKFRWMRGAKIL